MGELDFKDMKDRRENIISGTDLNKKLTDINETRQERSLQNYEKYLKHWNNYESQIKNHFK